MEKIITGIVGAIVIGFVGHYLGTNYALAVVGGWVLINGVENV